MLAFFTLMTSRSEDLASKKRYAEAGQVLLDYAEDEREAVIALVQGNQFSEARRIVSLTKHHLSKSHNLDFQIALRERPELLEKIINPAVLEARNQITEDLTEMREQLQKQLARLRELRIKKVEQPGTLSDSVFPPFLMRFVSGLEEFYGAEDVALHNIDVMTDASAFTAFTRYTAAPTASVASRTTKRSSRSKRKMERKVGSGRKGTVDEEEYLLKSLTKLAGRLATAQGPFA